MSFTIQLPKAKTRNALGVWQERKQIMKDRRKKRSKDARRKREAFDYGE
jgi:hypothetical protein